MNGYKIALHIAVFAACCSVCQAAPPPLGKIRDAELRTSVSEDIATINRLLARSDAKAAVDTATKLVAKARGHSRQNPADGVAYWAAWGTLLKVRSRISNKAEKDGIEAQWKAEIENGGPEAKWLIYALVENWDRSMTSGSFWKVFHTTRDPAVLSAACYLLFSRGEPTDVDLVRAQRAQEEDPKLIRILDATIEWMDFRHGVDYASKHKPTSRSPRVEMD